MTYDEFIKKYKGKGINFDKVYGVQCFDLANQFNKDVIGCGPFTGLYAHMIYTNYNSQAVKGKFTRIANTPDFIPKKGDIVVWAGSLNNGIGHVAIATGEGNTSYFYSYDQNWTGKNDPCTKIKHNYNHVLGVLRAKDQIKILGKTKVKEDKKVTSFPPKKIVDISMYQTNINYAKLAKAVDGVIIRVGYRGYGSSGTLCKDSMFDTHIKNVVKYKIPYGFYFFSQAKNAKEGKEEADYCYSLIKSYKPISPVYFDSELSGAPNNTGRADKISKTARTEAAVAFCKEIKAKGLTGGIYASESWFKTNLTWNNIKGYSIWCAKYGSNNGKAQTKPILSNYDGWQFTSRYSVDGINGKVDMSYFYRKFGSNEPRKEKKTTYKVYYVNIKEGLNYRKSPNGTLKGTYEYGKKINIIAGSEIKENNLIWVQTKGENWVAKKYLSTTNPVAAAPFALGNATLLYDLKVRSAAGTSNSQKKTKDLTAATEKKAYNQTLAVLKKSSTVKIFEIIKKSSKEYWGRIDSGYICLMIDGEKYIKQ